MKASLNNSIATAFYSVHDGGGGGRAPYLHRKDSEGDDYHDHHEELAGPDVWRDVAVAHRGETDHHKPE